MAKAKSITPGSVFGLLTVLDPWKSTRRGRERLCRCGGCNQEVWIPASRLGIYKSCGCRMHAGTHGGTHDSEYTVWSGIKCRCLIKTSGGYKNYGGRGIKICDRWKESYSNFLADMGRRPAGATIERIDNDRDYSPENCRWAPRQEQYANRRNTRKMLFRGKVRLIAEVASLLGISMSAAEARNFRGTLSNYE